MPNNLVSVLVEHEKEVVSNLISLLDFLSLLILCEALSGDYAALSRTNLRGVLERLMGLKELTWLVTGNLRFKVPGLLIKNL